MRYLLILITVSIVTVLLFVAVNWKGVDLSTATPLHTQDSQNDVCDDEGEGDREEYKLWVDTIMFANGHSFGYSGDVTLWEGWYYDTIPVGDDIMLICDSVGPSKMKISFITNEMIVDFKDVKAPGKIKRFLSPLDGFKRFQNNYEEILDSIIDKEYGVLRCRGKFSFTVDYADSCMENAAAINRFICNLSGISQNEAAKVTGLSAFYAGFNQVKSYRPVYAGNKNDMQSLSDFLACKTFENWRRNGDTDWSSNGATLEIRSRLVNSKFVTFSMYEYERIGLGHGMYTETFHTLDLTNGKELSNSDIFKESTHDKVKMLLFEVIANDPHYLQWYPNVESAADVDTMIADWQSPSTLLTGTEWEESGKDDEFSLPQAALTDKGVIFSFQPYEISCWAAGAFHFVVPYQKLMPYLTPHAKSLIN